MSIRHIALIALSFLPLACTDEAGSPEEMAALLDSVEIEESALLAGDCGCNATRLSQEAVCDATYPVDLEPGLNSGCIEWAFIRFESCVEQCGQQGAQTRTGGTWVPRLLTDQEGFIDGFIDGLDP